MAPSLSYMNLSLIRDHVPISQPRFPCDHCVTVLLSPASASLPHPGPAPALVGPRLHPRPTALTGHIQSVLLGFLPVTNAIPVIAPINVGAVPALLVTDLGTALANAVAVMLGVALALTLEPGFTNPVTAPGLAVAIPGIPAQQYSLLLPRALKLPRQLPSLTSKT